MKKRLALTLVASLLPTLALATGNHPMAGCGLGYLLLSHEENDKVTQILGATTNGTFGTQTFGISSGTSGCTQDGAVKLVRSAEVFAEVNLESLRRDMAVGQGEYVSTFASLISDKPAAQAELVQFFHSHYNDLFPSATTDSGEMLNRLTEKLSEHPEVLG